MNITPTDIRQAYEDAGVTATESIRQGVRKSIQVVEKRIGEAYEQYEADKAHHITKQDRILLRAQLSFLAHLGGQP